MSLIWTVKFNRPSSPRTRRALWLNVCIKLLTHTWAELLFTAPRLASQTFLFYSNALNNAYPFVGRNPLYSDFLAREFKVSYKTNNSLKSLHSPTSLKPQLDSDLGTDVRLLKQFKSFIRLNMSSNSTLTTPHFSFRAFYLTYSRGGLSIFNVTRLFTRWKEAYHLLFNLFFYDVQVISFGTSFFRTDILSLNWQVMSRFKFMWRYLRPFLIFKSNKINNYGDFIFSRLTLLGLRTAWVVDVLYHHKTIYYLHRAGFYSIGLVPTNYHIKSVNFAIPTTYDSLLTQVFFVRFVVSIQHSALQLSYRNVKKTWLNTL